MKILFIFNEFSLHNQIISEYLRSRPNDEVSLVKVPLIIKGKSRLETASSILPKLPNRFILEKLAEYFTVTAITLMPKLLNRGAIFIRLRRIAGKFGLPFFKAENIMDEATLEFIRSKNPDLIVTLVHQILKPKLIELAGCGVINIHPGLLPEFRGIQPYFWELASGFGRAGVTLHFIEDEKIDTGNILGRSAFPVWKGMSVQLTYYLTAIAAARLLPRCVMALETGEVHPSPQSIDNSRYFSWPDTKSLDELHARGHRLTSFRDLWAIITGKYDEFISDEELA